MYAHAASQMFTEPAAKELAMQPPSPDNPPPPLPLGMPDGSVCLVDMPSTRLLRCGDPQQWQSVFRAPASFPWWSQAAVPCSGP